MCSHTTSIPAKLFNSFNLQPPSSNFFFAPKVLYFYPWTAPTSNLLLVLRSFPRILLRPCHPHPDPNIRKLNRKNHEKCMKQAKEMWVTAFKRNNCHRQGLVQCACYATQLQCPHMNPIPHPESNTDDNKIQTLLTGKHWEHREEESPLMDDLRRSEWVREPGGLCFIDRKSVV